MAPRPLQPAVQAWVAGQEILTRELETLEKVTEKIDKLTVFGGLDGVLRDVVRIQVPSA